MQNLTDRALKERIIGAVVLVLAAILVVPIFLDGASDEQETVSTSVILPGQSGEDPPQERHQQTIVLNRDRSEPVPAAPSRPDTVPEETNEQSADQETVVREATEEATDTTQQSSPAESPVARAATEAAPPPPAEAVAAAASQATSATGMWAVQLGSFSSQENAEKLAADLRGQGYAAFLSQLQKDDAALHRVRIGPQKDRDSATAVAEQLVKSGHRGQVVPHP